MPLKHGYYLCDKRFHIDAVRPYFADKIPRIGVVLLSGEQANFYHVIGSRVLKVSSLSVHRRKAQKKGGQSAPRFQRLRLEQIAGFSKNIAMAMNKHFLDETSNKLDVQFVWIGYVGKDMKDHVLTCDVLSKHVLAGIQGSWPVESLDIAHFLSIHNVFDASKTTSETKAAQEFDVFLDMLRTTSGRIVYGPEITFKYLQDGFIQHLFVSASTESKAVLENARSVGAQITIVPDELMQFGSIVGILWSNLTDDTRDTIEQEFL